MNGILIFLLVIFIAMGGIMVLILTTMFKGIQFTLTATNLYKKMISREDLMIKLLIDIRDNTKTAEIAEVEKLQSLSSGGDGSIFCPSCQKSNGYSDANGEPFCPTCQKPIEK